MRAWIFLSAAGSAIFLPDAPCHIIDGVVVGIITPIAVSQLTTMKTIITPWSVLLAFGISGAVGIIFGLDSLTP